MKALSLWQRLDNVRALPRPIPVKGRQGLWVPGAEVQAEVGRQLATIDHSKENQ